MLKWIGIEERLLAIEEEKEYLGEMISQLKFDGIVVEILRGENCACREHLEDGLLILIELAGLPSLQEYIGKMPVIGYSLPETEGFDGRFSYIIGSFEGIDPAYCQMVYNRFYHRPLTIMGHDRWLLREMTVEDVPKLLEQGMTIRNPLGILAEDEMYSPRHREGAKNQNEQLELLQEETEYVKAYIENMYEFYNYGMWILCKPNMVAIEQQMQIDYCEDLQSNNAILGIAGLDHIDENDLPAESLIRQELRDTFCLQAGYHISKEYRRQGYGTEALNSVVEYGFSQIGVDWLVLFIEPSNEASIALALRAGFVWLEKTVYKGKEVQVYVMTEPGSKIKE